MFMKVRFWGTSTVTAVETQGYPGGPGRVTQYRLEISPDCSTVQPIIDDLGNNKVYMYMVTSLLLHFIDYIINELYKYMYERLWFCLLQS